METSVSSSSLHEVHEPGLVGEQMAYPATHQAVIVEASDDPPAGTTGQSANEVGCVSAMPVIDLSEVVNNASLDLVTKESHRSGDFSPENIGSHPEDDTGDHEPEARANTPTSAQSQAQSASVDNAAASPQSEEGSRPKTPQVDTFTGFDVGKLVGLMEEQVSLLRLLNERQAASDLSQQPMPEVSATSNSTWGALLRTTVAETIQPKIDRWRSGLDALLVFLGLFSAIVTAFLVESLSGLRPSETARTNELLANLTDIMIALNGVNPINLNLSAPAQFQPDSTDVRLNSCWSLSLILSLSVAALAVTCHGFLNMDVSRFDAKSNLIETTPTSPILTPKIISAQTIYIDDDNDIGISREDWEMAG
ncbi:hypothetical protein C8J57DRAFT_1567303 [Mycena rebaudengoi]|nr:hypothetical protein C8J57DRAFT_1567303 [Mycena rebaudengoi]